MNPTLASKHLRAGEAYAAKGHFAEALTEFQRALRLQPRNADAAGNAGAALQALGRSDEAISYFERAIALRANHPDAEYNLGNALSCLGHIDEACIHYERAVALRPAYAQAHANLAHILLGKGLHDAAVSSYRRAIAADPKHAGAHNGLGVALQQLGQFSEAQSAYQKAISLAPHDAQTHYNLATLHHEGGHLHLAIASNRDAIARNPAYAAAYNNLGAVLQESGADDAALAAYAKAFELNSRFAQAACNAGIVLCSKRRYDEACAFLRQAIAIEPHHASAHNALGIVFEAQGHFSEAIAEFEAAVASNPQLAEAYNNTGIALRALGENERAASAYRRAIALRPNYAEAHANLGTALMELGDASEAEAAYDRALSLVPENVRFLRGWSDLRKVTEQDTHIATMERLHQRISSLPVELQIDLEFALGKVYADIRRYDASFDHIAAGCALKRRSFQYDEPALLGLFDRIASAFTREFIAANAGAGDTSDIPFFVIGMPRSGTTLIEQILASHPDVYGAGERDDVFKVIQDKCASVRMDFPEIVATLAPADFAALGSAYLQRAYPGQHGARRVTDKMPSNFLYAGAIALMLPNARIVHVQRDAVDTCLSCYTRLFNEPQPHTYDLAELGRYYRAYERLMEHWRATLPDGVMLEVRYEDVVADFETQARRIIEHAGLPWDPRCIAFHETRRTVRTASATQVRQPLYSTSVGRNRNYGDRLAPLIDALNGR